MNTQSIRKSHAGVSRRELLQLGAASAATIPFLAAAPSVIKGATKTMDWRAEFRKGMQKHPWMLGWQSVSQDHFDSGVLPVQGKLPPELRGTLYRNGPARHEVGNMRYHHWFDGDGMVHGWRIEDRGISHKARMVRTKKYETELEAGRSLWPAFGTQLPGMRAIRGPDDLNAANISVVYHGEKLFALWEGGSPYEIDPQDLSTRGIHSYSEELEGVPFTAHPRLDADGSLWSFGYASLAGAVLLYNIAPDGQMRKFSVLRIPKVPMVHDFLITKQHIVLVMPPLFFRKKGAEGSFLDRHAWEPQESTQILVVDKDDLKRHQSFELPAFWVFHFGNAWEDDSGTIRFDVSRYEDPSVMYTTFRDVMHGQVTPPKPALLHMATLHTKTGRAEIQPYQGTWSEFPSIHPLFSGQRNRYLLALALDNPETQAHISFDTVVRLDLEQGGTSRFRYPDHILPEEHVHVPHPAQKHNENAGWILGTALDYRNAKHMLNIFRVDRLSDGPVASVTLSYPLPLGLHGRFVPA